MRFTEGARNELVQVELGIGILMHIAHVTRENKGEQIHTALCATVTA